MTEKNECAIILKNVYLCLEEGDTMINEEHVKELYQAASYDMKHQQEYQQVRRYFRSDYINKELLKSFFSGTFAYMIFCAIWIIVNGQEFVEQINQIDYMVDLCYSIFEGEERISKVWGNAKEDSSDVCT